MTTEATKQALDRLASEVKAIVPETFPPDDFDPTKPMEGANARPSYFGPTFNPTPQVLDAFGKEGIEPSPPKETNSP